MIQIVDRGDCLEVEMDMRTDFYSCWEDFWQTVRERGLHLRHNIFLREDNKLMKVKLDA